MGKKNKKNKKVAKTLNNEAVNKQDVVSDNGSKAVMTEVISFSLDKQTAEVLSSAAHDKRMNRSEFLRELIKKNL